MKQTSYQEILDFWFKEIDQSLWWIKKEEFDLQIRDRFMKAHNRATRCELFSWRKTAKGRLAEIIILDQFSRNMFRNSPLAFVHDPLALALAQEAISVGTEKELNQIERNFLYMPFMHSESLTIHKIAVELFQANGIKSSLDYEFRHKHIIEQFGRYPYRNEILGRGSTKQELDFLKKPGTRF